MNHFYNLFSHKICRTAQSMFFLQSYTMGIVKNTNILVKMQEPQFK